MPVVDPSTPASRYYTALIGRWDGRLRFRITDRGALARMPARTRLLGLASHFGGFLRMRTTLEGSGRAFRHTTEVRAWGVAAFTTEEVIELGDDGRSLRMSGTQRARFGAPETYVALGSIDEDATRATYEIPWLESPLVQRTRIVPEGLELTQDTPWSHAEVLLRRKAER